MGVGGRQIISIFVLSPVLYFAALRVSISREFPDGNETRAVQLRECVGFCPSRSLFSFRNLPFTVLAFSTILRTRFRLYVGVY